MIDVGHKEVTRRRAVASGFVHMAATTALKIQNKSLPKGDVLPLAEAAGIMSAKNTPTILPLCHPLNLDKIQVTCEVIIKGNQDSGVRVTCEVVTHAKTGVEMEALCGATAALLCIYDLAKNVDPVLWVTGVHLEVKEGGKSGVWQHPVFGKSNERSQEPPKTLEGIRCGVLTISDRGYRNESKDESGPCLESFLKMNGAQIEKVEIVPDEIEDIQKVVKLWAQEFHLAS